MLAISGVTIINSAVDRSEHRNAAGEDDRLLARCGAGQNFVQDSRRMAMARHEKRGKTGQCYIRLFGMWLPTCLFLWPLIVDKASKHGCKCELCDTYSMGNWKSVKAAS